MASSKNGTKADKPRKVIDVTAPGKSAPSSSARPIIVSNRPMIQRDPMMISNDSEGESPPPSPVATSIKIEPPKPSAEESPEKQDPPEPAPDKPERAQEETSLASSPRPDPKPPKGPPETSEATATEDTSEDRQATSETTLDSAEKQAAEKKVALSPEQEKIISSKQYFLPINAVQHRRGLQRAILVLVLVILLALVWLDVVLDAGIIKLGNLHPLTNLFSS